ncbi:putative phage abortive infection protein [Acinetobacter sp. HY1485]|uniref:putative phage abortive infection protein n=1 Tax=Acinetobacter sp. HY1485 TaxID=2970918 RepID=UPI0022B999D0|nr:putative phage abortive infection protein [Acinetobacter sp. HY1485]
MDQLKKERSWLSLCLIILFFAGCLATLYIFICGVSRQIPPLGKSSAIYINKYGYDIPRLSKSGSTRMAELGQVGDFFGGLLNPFLAFLSFVTLLYTINLQRKDGQKLARLQYMQQFDSTFFALLSELNRVLESLQNSSNGKDSQLDRSYDKIALASIEKFQELPNKLIRDREVSRYFMMVYQALKLINDKLSCNKNRKVYTNILRASISEKAARLLMINALHNDFSEYKKYLEQSNFFEHVSFDNLNNDGATYDHYNFNLLNAAYTYDEKVFGSSIYWKELNEDTVFGSFFKQNKYKDIVNNKKLIEVVLETINDQNVLKEYPDIVQSIFPDDPIVGFKTKTGNVDILLVLHESIPKGGRLIYPEMKNNNKPKTEFDISFNIEKNAIAVVDYRFSFSRLGLIEINEDATLEYITFPDKDK